MIKEYIELAGFNDEDIKEFSKLKNDDDKINWAKDNIYRMTGDFMTAVKNISALERGSYTSKRSKAYNMLSMLYTVKYM